ncbi:MAG: ABC transporter substrate-binding protein, partial [Firmicutes bacterium]|nr:ABC transporter substrate-binding protein [Bacillota bacterium]
MKRPISFALVMILVAGLLTGMLTGCAKKEPTTIKIGAFFPLTGPVGAQGVYQKQGVELAVEEINAAGGIKGKTVQVVFEDTQGKKENIPTIVRKLIEKDGAVSLVGEVISSNSIAAGPVVKQLKVPAIAPHSTNPAVTKDPEDPSKANPYYFRVIFTDPEQGSALATFASKELGKTKAAIIFN